MATLPGAMGTEAAEQLEAGQPQEPAAEQLEAGQPQEPAAEQLEAGAAKKKVSAAKASVCHRTRCV